MLDTMMQISLSLVAFDKMSRVISSAVRKSDAEFDKLQSKIKKTSETLDNLGKNFVKAGAGLTVAGTGLAYKLGITQAIPEVFEMEHRLRELGNVGQLSAKQLEEMDERLGKISKYTNQTRGEIAEGLNVLVASGIDPESALEYMNVIGRTATAAQASIEDISKTAFSVTDNLKVNVNDLAKTMDILAQAGKEGRFELKDMSAAFPSLTAGASMLGMKGVPAVAQLGAALQVAMKGAGSAPEAANNLENFIQEITAPLAVNRFKELYGIDIKGFLNQTIAEAKDPIEELVKLINKLTGGDAFAVSEIFRNKTVLNFLKPMMKNLDEYQRIKESALSANGIMDEDFNHMLETTTEQFKLLKINMKELTFPNLKRPLEKINEMLIKLNSNPLLQKGLFTAIIGTIGTGIVLSVLGTVMMAVSKITAGYGKVLEYARELTPFVSSSALKIFDKIGFNTTVHNMTYGKKILDAGNPLGIDISNFSIKNGIFADIRRIDKNMRDGIIKTFSKLPQNIKSGTSALKEWSITSLKALPKNILTGLNSLKTAFLNIPGNISKAITAFRAFSLTLLTSPLAWIAVILTATAFLIYKYWKPITAFFKGVWAGLKEGLQPIMPLLKRIADAFSPLFTPIKALIDWFKQLIKPVDDTGGHAEAMGKKFGKVIADIIIKFTELVTKVFEFGKKIGDMLSDGILSKLGKTKDAITKHAQIIRDHLPHSPAKTGPLKDLHKVKIMETIASTLKPEPLTSALSKSLGIFTSSTLSSSKIKTNVSSSAPENKITVNYNPVISLYGSDDKTKNNFKKILQEHKNDIIAIIKKEFERKERVAY